MINFASSYGAFFNVIKFGGFIHLKLKLLVLVELQFLCELKLGPGLHQLNVM
jgi:hypothetical protein